ncbi:hypothetical protein SmJEL517_g04887 [Synchytrium microbalum]|uniref:Amino acid permease/ SLC12A domain-containing protein n=1 Tax=Synchytrium microbalum TaxID=1806994 RepID=A0A507BXK0_9FUNG|nr:uncharacterized protein SmJEL517_g04887 [Synchytrium microbalum]TPX31868.1 hypothetical protein SmJEL517_g04887 [Synchytrium microbalum]
MSLPKPNPSPSPSLLRSRDQHDTTAHTHFESGSPSLPRPISQPPSSAYGINIIISPPSDATPPSSSSPHKTYIDDLYREAVKLPSNQAQISLSAATEYGVPMQRTLSEIVEDRGGIVLSGLARDEGLGTFRGVIVPNLEFMWSVLIFIRFGLITALAGVLYSLLLVVLCAIVVSFTMSSVSAIATNGVPRAGILSVLTRSLGKPIGAGIVLLYYVAVASFTSIEIVGSVEGLFEATAFRPLPSLYWTQVLLAMLCMIAISCVVMCGDRVVHPVSLFFMAVLIISFLSVLTGLVVSPFVRNMGEMVTGLSFKTLASNFWPSRHFDAREMLSLLFPCFVGIYTGVNHASQLKNPFVSIPQGGFTAIAISTSLYSAMLLLIAATIKREALLTKTMILAEVAYPVRHAAIAGVLLVGIGSALQCLVISSSVLQTLSLMDVLPGLAVLGLNKSILITMCLALPFLFISKLEELAVIVTTSFLLCYGVTNFAAFLLSVFKAPNWRPLFELHHWIVSLIGLFACFGVMIYISLLGSLLALVISVVSGYVIFVSSERVTFGEGLRSLLFHLSLGHLLSGETEEYHENVFRLTSHQPPTAPEECNLPSVLEQGTGKLWRPKILCFVDHSHLGFSVGHQRLLSLVAQLKSRSGLAFMIASTTPKDIDTQLPTPLVSDPVAWRARQDRIDSVLLQRRVQLQRAMRDERLRGFSKSLFGESLQDIQNLTMDGLGLGELQPNTVVAIWPQHHNHHHHGHHHHHTGDENLHEGFQYLMDLTLRRGNTFMIVKGIGFFPSNRQRLHGTIDVWWTNDTQSSQTLPLLIAYILQQHRVWAACCIRIFVAAHTTENHNTLEATIRLNLTLLRIPVESVEVVAIQLPYHAHQLPITIDSKRHSTAEADGTDDEEVYLLSPKQSHSPSYYTFAKTWSPHVQRHLSNSQHRRDLFLRGVAAASLKMEIDARSSKHETALVIMNVPGIDQDGAMQLSVVQRGILYTELIEYLTSSLTRTLLVIPGAKAVKTLQNI